MMVRMSTHKDDEKEHEPLTSERIDRKMAAIFEQKNRQETAAEAASYVCEAHAKVLAAIDALIDINDEILATTALRGVLPELDRALGVLRVMHGNCNRAIANISRRRTVR